MIWRRLLGIPKDGGGNLKRFLEIRKQLFIKNWTETSLTSDKVFKGPVTLFDFSRPHDQADAHFVSTKSGATRGWKISDDGTLGGFSKGSLKLYYDGNEQGEKVDVDVDIETIKKDNLGESNLDSDKNDTLDDKIGPLNDQTSNSFQPFVRWHGSLSTRLPEKNRDNAQVHRSGYCYVRLPEFPMGGVPLKSRYNALEIRCRSDGRLYAVNLKVDTFLPDDLYQGFINVPSSNESLSTNSSSVLENIPVEFRTEQHKQDNQQALRAGDAIVDDDYRADEFTTLVLPFRDFVLTAGGRPREYQRILDGDVTINHVGFMLADGQDGNFQFDIARLRVVNYSDGEILDDDDDNYDDATGGGERVNRENAQENISQK